MIEVNNILFKTQKELTEYVQKLIRKIGITNDVSDVFLYELIKRHAYYTEKTKNMKSIGIELCPNPDFLRLYILNIDNTQTEISFIKCIANKQITESKYNKQLFFKALRHSIDSQIQAYKLFNFPAMCELCNDEAEHADHINHFEGIGNDFIKQFSIIIPTDYIKIPITFNIKFCEEDNDIKLLFQEYHKQVAKLRPLCKHCNLTRTKYK
jgi:hypothetical protein